MAVQFLGGKSFSSIIRSRFKTSPGPFARDFTSPSPSSRCHHPHSYSRAGSRASSVPTCFKTICAVAYSLPCLSASGTLSVRADWSRISSSCLAAGTKLRITGEEVTKTLAQQRIPVAGAESISLNLSNCNLKAEEKQETRAIVGKMVAVRNTVELTEMEEKIFGTLTATLCHFGLKTQLRVAGGSR